MTDPVRTYFPDGSIETEEWLVDDKFHRVDGPAYSSYYFGGQPSAKSWYINGKYHKTDGPSAIGYFYNGQVDYEKWFVNGALHRLDGPAHRGYFPNGKLVVQYWYIHNKKVQPFYNDLSLIRSCVKTFKAIPRSARSFLKNKGYSDKEIATMRNNARASLELL